MLILTRRRGETLRIGQDIEVMVVSVQGQQVRLGIKAPREVQVDRQEIWERKVLEAATVRDTADAIARQRKL
jgi:carbon storage regulator